MTSMIISTRHYELFVMILNSPHLILLEILIEFSKVRKPKACDLFFGKIFNMKFERK